MPNTVHREQFLALPDAWDEGVESCGGGGMEMTGTRGSKFTTAVLSMGAVSRISDTLNS